MPTEPPKEDVYRLKYKDSEGTSTERHIIVRRVTLRDKPAHSYIHAYCLSAQDLRTFRLDRVKALYQGKQKINSPFEFLSKKYDGSEPEPAPEDTSKLAAEALAGDERNEPEENAATPIKSPFPTITDIPTAKKGIRNLYIIAAILIMLGFISMPTVILPILFFAGALFFIAGARNIKKQIKALKAEVK